MKHRAFFLTFLVGFLPAQAAPDSPPPAARKDLVVDSIAMLSDWSAPIYPADALKEKVGGRVVIRIIVDDHGVVTGSRVLTANDPRLGEAALTAVRQWKFTAALDEGKPVVSCLDVPVIFDEKKGENSWKTDMGNKGGKAQWKKPMLPPAGQLPMQAPSTSAEPKRTPEGDYPDALRDKKIAGWLRFSCQVDPTGHAQEPKILGTSHVEFVLPGLATLARWEFAPATQGDLKLTATVKGEITFEEIGGKRAEVLKLNGLTAPDGGEPADTPELQFMVEPVYPHSALLAGTGGEALVEFTMGTSGSVEGMKLRSASQPEFGQAAMAALEMWVFRPPTSDGKPVAVPFLKKVVFPAVPLDVPDTTKDENLALVKALRAGKIEDARGLDEKLTPIFRLSPIYPAALAAMGKPAGAVEIEFIIARDGRVRLPKIVSSTHEEFGWAAATAITQWVFKAPMRGGKPVDVKVRIPMSFTPPEG